MDNDNIFAPVKAMVVPIVLGIVAGLSTIPWVQIGTFLTILLNGAYVVYKWFKSHAFNKINLRKAAISLEKEEEELRQIKSRA